ncbi:MAG: hypothetical protein IPP94_11120 [Ignavibacteria bacterium]|nr:hypothetical protein [Ignavibacteria bacterium]
MKHLILSALLVATVVLSACEQQSSSTDPVAQSPATSGVVMDQQLIDDYNSLLGAGDVLTVDPTLSPSINSDMDASMWLRLILSANRDVTERQKLAAQELIAASNARRARILAQKDLSREKLAALLQAEHDALMKALNALFTPEQLRNAQALKDKLDKERLDRQAKLDLLKIQRHVEILTKQLTLTERQQATVTEILKKQAMQIVELRKRFANDPEGLRKGHDAPAAADRRPSTTSSPTRRRSSGNACTRTPAGRRSAPSAADPRDTRRIDSQRPHRTMGSFFVVGGGGHSSSHGVSHGDRSRHPSPCPLPEGEGYYRIRISVSPSVSHPRFAALSFGG